MGHESFKAFTTRVRPALPCVTHHKTRKHMFDDYCKVFERQAKILGRSTFYQIMKEITGSEEKIFTAVDYVTGVLVHDSIEMCRRSVMNSYKTMWAR